MRRKDATMSSCGRHDIRPLQRPTLKDVAMPREMKSMPWRSLSSSKLARRVECSIESRNCDERRSVSQSAAQTNDAADVSKPTSVLILTYTSHLDSSSKRTARTRRYRTLNYRLDCLVGMWRQSMACTAIESARKVAKNERTATRGIPNASH
jgi:hypothetical protein